MKEKKKIAIIGAGIGGMSAAFDLVSAGHEVVIYESSDHVGGLASGFSEPEWKWTVEKFYHHWFMSDVHMLELIDELGLRDKVIFPRPVTVMFHEEKFHPFDSILAALLYPGLGWGLDKIRFGLVGLFLRLTTNWQALEKSTVNDWMRKWAGSKVYEEMWEPMLVGKFGERYAHQVNMAWMWARIHSRTTRLGTFEGGFQVFANTFAERLQSMGVNIHLNAPVDMIKSRPDSGLELHTRYGAVDFDQCLVTTSPAQLAHLAAGLPEDYLKGLLDLKSLGAVVMIFSLKQQLSKENYYWYNLPKKAGFPFLALVEHTNFLPPAYFNGEHLVYAGDYLETDHEYFSMTKDELAEKFLPSFQRINPDFKPDWVNRTWLFKAQYAQPVPLVNHSQNIPAIQTPIPGLYFASMSQVYPWDRGTNYAVEISRRAARLMLSS